MEFAYPEDSKTPIRNILKISGVQISKLSLVFKFDHYVLLGGKYQNILQRMKWTGLFSYLLINILLCWFIFITLWIRTGENFEILFCNSSYIPKLSLGHPSQLWFLDQLEPRTDHTVFWLVQPPKLWRMSWPHLSGNDWPVTQAKFSSTLSSINKSYQPEIYDVKSQILW